MQFGIQEELMRLHGVRAQPQIQEAVISGLQVQVILLQKGFKTRFISLHLELILLHELLSHLSALQ